MGGQSKLDDVADPIVIVGAGVTAGSAVQTLRKEGHDGGIVVVGEEPDPPYERPPLSKEFLRGEQDRPALLLHDAGWYGEQGVDLRLGTRAVALDDGPGVTLGDGDRIPAAAVLLATGGRPRILPGAEPSERIAYLRTITDSERIRPHLEPGRRLLIVGAGFIGAEVAASARQRGAEVVLIDVFDVPLQRVLGDEMGAVVAEIHRANGVDVRMPTGVEAVEERGDAVVVRLRDGTELEGDLAVVGIGIAPNVEPAEMSGVATDNGVVVDELGRTSVPGVFAAGDVANHFHPVFGRHLRVEHFDNALKHGAAVARNMLGAGQPYTDPHWFWSDQYDQNLQYGGFAERWDEIVVRGSIEDRSFVAFFMVEGRVRAAFGVNRGREVRRSLKLIAAGATPDAGRLRDEEIDLRTLTG